MRLQTPRVENKTESISSLALAERPRYELMSLIGGRPPCPPLSCPGPDIKNTVNPPSLVAHIMLGSSWSYVISICAGYIGDVCPEYCFMIARQYCESNIIVEHTPNDQHVLVPRVRPSLPSRRHQSKHSPLLIYERHSKNTQLRLRPCLVSSHPLFAY